MHKKSTHMTPPLTAVVLASGISAVLSASTTGSASFCGTTLGDVAAGVALAAGTTGLGAAAVFGAEDREPNFSRSAYVRGAEGAELSGSFCKHSTSHLKTCAWC